MTVIWMSTSLHQHVLLLKLSCMLASVKSYLRKSCTKLQTYFFVCEKKNFFSEKHISEAESGSDSFTGVGIKIILSLLYDVMHNIYEEIFYIVT